MARLLPYDGDVRNVPAPLTLTKLQEYVEGYIRFIELTSGDILVVNEAASEFGLVNHHANQFAGKHGPIYGNAVLCSPSEIE